MVQATGERAVSGQPEGNSGLLGGKLLSRNLVRNRRARLPSPFKIGDRIGRVIRFHTVSIGETMLFEREIAPGWT